MRIVGAYSFKGGKEVMQEKYAKELEEIYHVIRAVDSSQHKTKKSAEKTTARKDRMLFSPTELNEALKVEFHELDWNPVRVRCDYPLQFYTEDYNAPKEVSKAAFREMDFVKNRIGVEVQFGKYSFMVYNVAAKMTIFRNLGHIDVGVEIVPVKEMVDDMSSGVSYFEQFLWDLEARGTSDIDIPVLILGIAPSLAAVQDAVPSAAQELAAEIVETLEDDD